MARLPEPLRPFWPYLKSLYTVATRLVGTAGRLVARRRRGSFLPHSFADHVESAGVGVTVETVRPEHRIDRELPSGAPADLAVFAAHISETVPRVAVALLPNGRVMAPHAAVVSAEGRFVSEFNEYFGTRRPTEHPVFLHPRPQAPLQLSGRVGVLATRGDANFYHFLMDAVPRLGAYRDASRVPYPDRWYAPRTSRFQRELLELLGLDESVVIDSGAVPHIRADELVVAGLPDSHLRAPLWAVDYLRRRLRPADAKLTPGRRIYVTRGRRPNTRIVVNEDELLAALAPLGFEVVDPGALSVTEQITTFATAEAIVAPHGAALTNLAFVARGSAVLELFPPRFVQGCFWKITHAVGDVRYRYLVGGAPAGDIADAAKLETRPDRMRAVSQDIQIRPDVVVRHVNQLLTGV